jgi:hypothetical protein
MLEKGRRIAHKPRMRMIPLFTLTLLAGCVAAPPPTVPPPAPPRPVPTTAPAPVADDWRDWPVTPGDWRWQAIAGGNVATYGSTSGTPVFSMRCDRSGGRVTLTRHAAPGATAMTIRTTTTVRALPTRQTPDGATVTLGARDGLLDAMGHSRGRFTVEDVMLPALVIPSWAEVLRVIEDCR